MRALATSRLIEMIYLCEKVQSFSSSNCTPVGINSVRMISSPRRVAPINCKRFGWRTLDAMFISRVNRTRF